MPDPINAALNEALLRSQTLRNKIEFNNKGRAAVEHTLAILRTKPLEPAGTKGLVLSTIRAARGSHNKQLLTRIAAEEAKVTEYEACLACDKAELEDITAEITRLEAQAVGQQPVSKHDPVATVTPSVFRRLWSWLTTPFKRT